jgi:RNA polymerase sigma factor (sigma-70 family)
VVDRLRQAVLPDDAELADSEPLDRFIESHDEAAFAVLVKRHGPMVWGVCRRLLHRHDAEDAFQATFLVLARKAASIRSKAAVGSWLYGVAHQTALQARRSAARRRAKEVQVTTMPDPEAAEPDVWADSQPVLDEELSRLPDIYRAVVVLCELEGRTRKEVARLLGVPQGTVGGRLARARVLLAKRLTRRGIAMSGGALAVSASSASASIPLSLVTPTIEAASLLAAGRAAGAVSVEVTALIKGVMKAMFMTRLKSVLVMVLVAGMCCGVVGAMSGTPEADPGAGKQKSGNPAGVSKSEDNPTPPPAARPGNGKAKGEGVQKGKTQTGISVDVVIEEVDRSANTVTARSTLYVRPPHGNVGGLVFSTGTTGSHDDKVTKYVRLPVMPQAKLSEKKTKAGDHVILRLELLQENSCLTLTVVGIEEFTDLERIGVNSLDAPSTKGDK